MKKFLIMFALMLGMVSVNAQTALQESKLTDNISVGVNAGVSTPLSFNKVFPLNPTVGIRIGKEFSPVFGVNIEGTTWLGSNDRQWFIDGFKGQTDELSRIRESNRFDVPDFEGAFHNTFRGINVGVNGTVNLTNLFLGYNGAPRSFELVTVTGLGWGHVFAPSGNFPDGVKSDKDNLTAKIALDFTFNLGKSKATSFYVEPAVLWNLNGSGFDGVQFNKNRAQLALSVGFVYHFKTSNGTRHFKTYDVGAMVNEINRLNEELAKKPTEVIKTVNNTNTVFAQKEWVVQFAQGKSDLTDDAKSVLDEVPTGTKVNVVGIASPEGTDEFNNKLSEMRAATVADYLKNRGVTISSWIGKGVAFGESTNRLAIVTVTD